MAAGLIQLPDLLQELFHCTVVQTCRIAPERPQFQWRAPRPGNQGQTCDKASA